MDFSKNKCRICGGKLAFAFFSEDYRYDIKGKFSYYKCKGCGVYSLIHVKAVDGYPDNSYYSYRQKSSSSFKERLSLFLYPIFYSPGFNPLSILFFFFRPFTRGTRIVKNGKFLDVGCGNGAFLGKMKALGLDVYGIEPGKIPDSSIRKYNIQNVQTIDSKYPEGFFDVITMNHVIEHSNSPVKDINKLKGYLKPKGLFIIAAPNIDSMAFRIFKKYWVQVDAPRHVYLFSESGLKDILKKSGFKVIKVRHNSMPFQFLSSMKIFFKSKGKNASFLDFWLIRYMFIPICFLVNLLRIGDQVEIWAEKV